LGEEKVRELAERKYRQTLGLSLHGGSGTGSDLCLGGPGQLPARGSRGPVRACINAYGSSSHGLAARRQTEWTATAAGNGYRASSRLKIIQVIGRSRLRRLSHLCQSRVTHMRNAWRQ
jgi:hypothetical protein